MKTTIIAPIAQTQPQAHESVPDFIVFDAGTVPKVLIFYRKTFLGWWNLYYPGANKPAFNVSPEVFARLFPDVSEKALYGCAEVSVDELYDLEVSALVHTHGVISMWTAIDAIVWYARRDAQLDGMDEIARKEMEQYRQLILDRCDLEAVMLQ